MKLNKENLLFREIVLNNIENHNKLNLTFYRAIIRYSIRFLSYKYSKFIIRLFFFMTNDIKNKFLININLQYLDSINEAQLSNWVKYIEIKNKIVSNILNFCDNIKEKKAALFYSSLLKNDNQLFTNLFTEKDNRETKILIYGPNSQTIPINDCDYNILVLTKVPKFKINDFPEVFLFINNHTAKFLKKKDLDLIDSNLTIYTDDTPLNWGTIKTIQCNLTPRSNLFSPMALQRILFQLLINYNNSYVNIVGFDLYTKKNGYSGNILTALPLADKVLTEKIICKSLLDHDPVFNYLYLKIVLQHFKIMDKSKDLKNLLDMGLYDYLKLLSFARKFKLVTI